MGKLTVSVDIISRRIRSSSRSPILLDEGFLKKKKKKIIWVEKSDFLASLWWTVTRIAKKSSQKTWWQRHSAGAERAEWWMRGTWCSQEQGGGGGNDGAAGTCAWGSVRLRLPPWQCWKRQGERGSCWASFLNLCCCPCHSLNVGGEGTEKSHFPWVHSGPLASRLPFHPVPSPLPFLSPAEWSYLVLYPPLQKLFHPCLHSF